MFIGSASCRGGKSPNPAAGTLWNSQHSAAGPRHPGIVAGARAEKDGIAVVPRRSEPTHLPSPSIHLLLAISTRLSTLRCRILSIRGRRRARRLWVLRAARIYFGVFSGPTLRKIELLIVIGGFIKTFVRCGCSRLS